MAPATTLLVVFSLLGGATPPSPRTPRVRDGAIGVAFVTEETADTLALSLVFPVTTLREELTAFPDREHAVSVQSAKRVQLFDDQGVVGDLPPFSLTVQQWCENDGGVHYRPQATVTVKKTALARPLRAIAELQGVAAFVMTSPGTTTAATKPSGKVFITGRAQPAGPVVAYLFATHDGANNCRGKPQNDWVTTLRTGKRDDELRCCGP